VELGNRRPEDGEVRDVARTYAEMVAEARAADRQLVLVERDAGHAVVTLSDPDRLNPLSATMTVQLRATLDELGRDEDLRAIVLTGADPAFSSGGDLRLMRDAAREVRDGGRGAPEVWRWIRVELGGIARLVASTDKAFIAAVNGAAAGAGLAFALACDLILCSEEAQLVPAFGQLGELPEIGTSWLLTRRLGYQGAFEVFVGGRHISGAEAAEIGLANEVVPHAELLGRALEWCSRIEALPPHVVPMTKPLLRGSADMTWDQAVTMEEYAQPQCFTTEVVRETLERLADSTG
jgi:2-(1,2-epoxy-1,2-dihydrophenyl)acetyl-CoA isomerase